VSRSPQYQFVGPVALDGKLDADVRVQVADYIRTFAGETIELNVRKYKSKRSLAQNARYWALLTCGAISLWEDPSQTEVLHEEIAHLLLALPPCEKTGLRRRMRTPKLNTSEFSVYMERVQDKLIELGADLSDWDDYTRRFAEAA
jgi:hypothetical protein